MVEPILPSLIPVIPERPGYPGSPGSPFSAPQTVAMTAALFPDGIVLPFGKWIVNCGTGTSVVLNLSATSFWTLIAAGDTDIVESDGENVVIMGVGTVSYLRIYGV